MTEAEIQDFWQKNPCGAGLVGDLSEREKREFEAFFERYDQYRYTKEAHILHNLDRIDFNGKRVLEIGLGQGADAERLVRRGAVYSGVDLTEESVARVRTRFQIKGLTYDKIERASVLSLPFDDDSFDIVFSHGVLHHVPDIRHGSTEIARVLKPVGELIAMVYAKHSLNYLLSISLLRRTALLSLYGLGVKLGGIIGEHLINARDIGIWRYLKMENFIHRNTDGPSNPYSKVYTLPEIARDFPGFEIVRSYKCFMHAPPLPVGWLPLEKLLGWHLWVHLRPKKAIL